MQTVFQGYAGMIPCNFADFQPEVEILDQGTWCDLPRPDMIRTDGDLYDQYAELFYAAQEWAFGPNSDYYAVFVEGTFETMGSITYETKNASYAVVNVHQYGTVRIYGGTFKGSQIDNNGVGQIYIYGGTFEEIIYNGPSALVAIYGGTFLEAIGTQGKAYIYDGEFLKAVNAYYNGVVTVDGGHFAAGSARPQATGTHKKGENSFCISSVKK